MQEKLAVHLRTLDTFAELSACCLSLDSELKRIAARTERQKRFRDKPSSVAVSPSLGASLSTPNATLHSRATSETPRNYRTTSGSPYSQGLRQGTPVAPPPDALVTCYNCHKTGHYASSCPEPKKYNLKEIEEDEDAAKESGKEEP